MVRAARRYDLYLPLTFNDGAPIPDQLFAGVEKTLLVRFEGITSQQRAFPLKGIWQGNKHLYFDQVIVVTVLDFRRGGSRGFWAKTKKALLTDFGQLEILVTESSLRVH